MPAKCRRAGQSVFVVDVDQALIAAAERELDREAEREDRIGIVDAPAAHDHDDHRGQRVEQWVIRTVSGCTMTLETRPSRPAVMSVTLASSALRANLFVDRLQARRPERRLGFRGLQERQERPRVQFRIAGRGGDVVDRRMAKS